MPLRSSSHGVFVVFLSLLCFFPESCGGSSEIARSHGDGRCVALAVSRCRGDHTEPRALCRVRGSEWCSSFSVGNPSLLLLPWAGTVTNWLFDWIYGIKGMFCYDLGSVVLCKLVRGFDRLCSRATLECGTSGEVSVSIKLLCVGESLLGYSVWGAGICCHCCRVPSKNSEARSVLREESLNGGNV